MRVPDGAYPNTLAGAPWLMNLDTYRSAAIDGVFVTLPSTAARSTIGLIDDLSALRLRTVRREYEFSEEESCAPFARFVLTEIVLKGYARHGLDRSFCARPKG